MTNKIPKIIHYCWFGDNKKPEIVLKCIESWRKYLPDYEIREWNDADLKKCNNKYVQQAYENKKWAFISDYYRLYALFNYGGIYLDSDNEVFKTFDDFLDLDFFTGFENYYGEIKPFTAVVGAKKGNNIVKKLLEEYDNFIFVNKDNTLNLCTNTQRVTNYFKDKYNLIEPYDGRNKVELEKNHIIFPYEYFCPKIIADDKYKITKNTYAVHHFAGSWNENVYNFKNIFLPFDIKIGCYICKIKTKSTNKLPDNEIKILSFIYKIQNYIVITISKGNLDRRTL